MKVGVVTLVATLLLGFGGAQQRVSRIDVENCEVTKPEIVLEAAGISEGMEFDEEKIRQALLDLGLFDRVSVQHEPRPDGTVAVTVSVTEKKFPTPTNAAAAKALDLQALVARCWEEEAANLRVEDFLKGKVTFRFWLLSSIRLDWKPTSKASWAQKFVQWQSNCDEKLKGNLRRDLENHLRRYPNDLEARLAFNLLLAETKEFEEFKEVVAEFHRLLNRHPDLHWAYSLRLSALISRPFFLPTKLPQVSDQISVTATGEFAKLALDPSEVNWLRGELILAIEEGERHFRQLPAKRWNKDAVKAAAKFFADATTANFLLAMVKTVEEMSEEYGEEFLPPNRLVEPFTRYFNDFLRISQIAQRFADDAEVQWAMVVWGEQMVGSMVMLSLAPAFKDDRTLSISELGKAISAQRNLYKPALERWVWHLQRVIALDKQQASTALALLAVHHAIMGDFGSARVSIETGLRQPQPDVPRLAEAIGALMNAEAIFTIANRPSEERAIMAALRRRYADWLNRLRANHPFVPQLTFMWSVMRIAESSPAKQVRQEENHRWDWSSVSETVRQEVLKALKDAADRNPRSDFAQRVFGLTLILENKVEQALPYLSKAHELNPKWFYNRYALALVYLMTGETEKALSLFQSDQ